MVFSGTLTLQDLVGLLVHIGLVQPHPVQQVQQQGPPYGHTHGHRDTDRYTHITTKQKTCLYIVELSCLLC